MKYLFAKIFLLSSVVAVLFTGCATKPYDYTNFRAHRPRSILIIPPLNESTAVGGTYSYLSTVTMPISEMGFYVFPVAVVDQFFKENGMPTAGEMHQAPLEKINEVIGADAVLYITLKQYGTKYQILNSATIVVAAAKLVDTKTGLILWQGTVAAQQNSNGSGNLLADLVTAALDQIINNAADHAHEVSRLANAQFGVKKHGLLLGPRHPKFGTE